MPYMGEAVALGKACFAPLNDSAHASVLAGHRSCDVGNGGREQLVNVQYNTGIPYIHVGQINDRPRVTSHILLSPPLPNAIEVAYLDS
jgi:hypothetical protein